MSKPKMRTLKQRLFLLSGILLLNVIMIAGLSLWISKDLGHHLRTLSNVELPAIRLMTLVDMMHDGLRANYYLSLLKVDSQNNEERAEIVKEGEEFRESIQKNFKNLEALDFSEDIKRSLLTVGPKIEAYTALQEKLTQFSHQGNKEKAFAGEVKFQQSFSELATQLGQLGENIEKEAIAESDLSIRSADFSFKLSWVLLVVGVLLNVCLSFFTIRSLQKELSTIMNSLDKESGDVRDSSQQLTQSSTSVAESSQQQAAALQETASAIEEITSMVKQTQKSSESLEVSAQRNQESATKGKSSIAEMLESIDTIAASNDRIMSQVEASNQQITEIVKVISEIGQKTKVINDIVFQTKLLSFNASVEAARAGEHGKGFAVVAEEVGNLAQMSGTAAKEISSMLESGITRVEGIVDDSKTKVMRLIEEGKISVATGAKVAKTCGETLEQIVTDSEHVSKMVSDITVAIQEQTQGISEISKAIALLDQSTHKNSAAATQSLSTAERLYQQSDELTTIVKELSSLVDQPKGDMEAQSQDFGMTRANGHGDLAGPIHVKKAA